jgi:hypothetical protein
MADKHHMFRITVRLGAKFLVTKFILNCEENLSFLHQILGLTINARTTSITALKAPDNL